MADDIYGMTFYLCDQKKDCSDRDGCIANGGYCKYTTDVEHAKNGPIEKGPKVKKRFNVEHYEHCEGTYYWERDFEVERAIKEIEDQIEVEKEVD